MTTYKLNLDRKIKSAFNQPLKDNVTTPDGQVEVNDVTPRDLLRRVVWEIRTQMRPKTSEVREQLAKVKKLMAVINEEAPFVDYETGSDLLTAINGGNFTAFVLEQMYDIYPPKFFEAVEKEEQELINKANGTVAAQPTTNDEAEAAV